MKKTYNKFSMNNQVIYVMFWALVLMILCCESHQAFSSSYGTSGFSFLKSGFGTRATSLGYAATGSFYNWENLYYNPAGINMIHGISGGVYTEAETTGPESFGAGFLAAKNGNLKDIGLSIYFRSYDRMQRFDPEGHSDGSWFGADEMLVFMTQGMNFSGISFGWNVKFIRETVDIYSSNAIAFDLGVLKSFETRNLCVGASVRNLGLVLNDLGHKDEDLPLLVSAGMEMEFRQGLKFLMDLKKPLDYSMDLSLGFEYQVLKCIFFRGGMSTKGWDYSEGDQLLSGLSMGVGWSNSMFSFDYTFASMGDLGQSHLISFGLSM